MPRPAYAPARVEELQGQILEATLLVFRRDGFPGVSLRAIASELGWTPAALYRYFPSKDALIAAIRAEGFRRMEDVLRDAEQQGTDPLERVRRAMSAYLRFATEEPEVFRLMYDLQQRDAAPAPHVVEARERAFSVARGIAAQAVAAGQAHGDPNVVAHLYWASVHGLAMLATAEQLDLGAELDELTDALLQLLTGPEAGGRG